jgi:hypothetical protein
MKSFAHPAEKHGTYRLARPALTRCSAIGIALLIIALNTATAAKNPVSTEGVKGVDATTLHLIFALSKADH